MIRMEFPLSIPIDVSSGSVVEYDRFNNEVIVTAPYVPVTVFAWSITPVDEKQDDSTLRVVDELEVVMRPEDAPNAAGQFRTPDGSEWQVEGSPRDPNNNPWWQPGLVTVKGRRVTG